MLSIEAIINGTLCTINKHSYSNKRLALTATDKEDGFPFATLSVNLINAPCKSDEVYLDVNNVPTAGDDLRKAGIIEGDPISWTKSGYVEYPRYKVNQIM